MLHRPFHLLTSAAAASFVCVTIFAASCATTKPRHMWTEQALQAETAQFEGRLDEAEAEYQRLLGSAPNADKRRWLELNLGLLALQRGDEELGRERLAVVYEANDRDEHGANALYEVAKLAPPDQGVAARLRVVHRYPNQVAAEFALQEIVAFHEAHEQFGELQTLLEQLTGEVGDTELGDNVWFELALLRHDRLADPNGALDAYRHLYANYTKGPLADDALWEMANIYREYQQWQPAITLLTKLANDVEASWFVGSYDSDWVDDAIYDVGWIKLVHLSDYAGARDWFKRYLKKFPDGLLNDDAAWNLVEAQRLSGDAGYREAMKEFVREYPESRYVRVATARLEGES